MTSTPTPSLERGTSVVAYLPRNPDATSPTEPNFNAAPFVSLRRWSWSESNSDDPDELERIPRPQSQPRDIDVRIRRAGDDTGLFMSTVEFATESRNQERQIASEQTAEPEYTLSEQSGHGYIFGRHTILDSQSINPPYFPTSGLDSNLRDSAGQLFIQINKDEALARRKDTFRPINVPPGHAPLDFRPLLLRPKWTLTLTTLYLGIVGGLVALLRTTGPDHPLVVSSENVHLVARYGPSLTATITSLLFRQTARDITRMRPYFHMADNYGRLGQATSKQSVGGSYFPFQDIFVVPISVRSFCLWLVSLIVATLVSAKSVLLGTVQDGMQWKVTVRSGAAVFLIVGYSLMAFVNIAVTLAWWGRSTGLKWDPVSLADYAALFARSNSLDCFEKLEHDGSIHSWWNGDTRRAWRHIPDHLRFRLGYWKSTSRDSSGEFCTEVVYGIGTLDDWPINIRGSQHEREQQLYAHAEASDSEKILWPTSHDPRTTSSGSQVGNDQHKNTTGQCGCVDYPKCGHYPYQTATGLARGWLIYWLLLVVTAVTACIYALACGAVSDGGFSIPNTWLYDMYNGTQTSTPTDDNIWLAGNVHDDGNMFIYADVFRALPTQFSYSFAIGFLSSLDESFRFTQPFVGMFDDAELAETTLSLNYLTASSLQVPLDACDNGHWKVAWFATLATLAPLFPVMVTGLFTITETKTTVHFLIEKPAFWVIATYLAFFLISLPLAWPTYSRSTPRFALSLADLMGMCHQARFLEDPVFDVAGPKCSKDKMQAQLLLRENKYLFGWYLGRDGKPHVGFDMAETEVGGATGLVKWIPPTKDWTRKCDSKPPLLDRLLKGKYSKVPQKAVEEGMEMASILTHSETSPDNIPDNIPETPVMYPGGMTVRDV